MLKVTLTVRVTCPWGLLGSQKGRAPAAPEATTVAIFGAPTWGLSHARGRRGASLALTDDFLLEVVIILGAWAGQTQGEQGGCWALHSWLRPDKEGADRGGADSERLGRRKPNIKPRPPQWEGHRRLSFTKSPASTHSGCPLPWDSGRRPDAPLRPLVMPGPCSRTRSFHSSRLPGPGLAEAQLELTSGSAYGLPRSSGGPRSLTSRPHKRGSGPSPHFYPRGTMPRR